MDFVGVQFLEDGSLAIVHEKWLTPHKTKVYWPPCSKQYEYDKHLKCGDGPDHQWELFSLSKVFFETDNFELAKKNIKKLEYTSDIQSEDESIPVKRKRAAPRRLSYGSINEGSDDDLSPQRSVHLKHPPRINFKSLETSIRSGTPVNTTVNNQTGIASSNTMRPETRPNPNTPTIVQCDRKHQELTTLLLQIKEQNNQILSWIRSQSIASSVPRSLPENFPVTFPLRNNNNVEELENHIALKENLDTLSVFLSSLGGRDVNNRVNVILRHIFDDKLASTYNFCGTRSNKTAFKDLHLRISIIDAIKRVSAQTTEKEIDGAIKTWLKHAPERVKLGQRSNSRLELNDA